MEFSLATYVFECPSYVDFLHSALSGTADRNVRKPRGSLLKLSRKLNCHPSFIAQVLSGKAHLSIDQALLTCEHFNLQSTARDHFVDLLLAERSGLTASKSYFRKRIENRKSSMENLSERWGLESDLNESKNLLFFSSWLNQMIYSLLQIPKYSTAKALASALGLPIERVSAILKLLISLNLVERKGKTFRPLKNWLHLPKASPAIRSHHQTWRLRALDEFTSTDLPGFHYSGALTISKAHAQWLRSELLKLLDFTRETVAQSESEECHTLLIDFFPSLPQQKSAPRRRV